MQETQFIITERAVIIRQEGYDGVDKLGRKYTAYCDYVLPLYVLDKNEEELKELIFEEARSNEICNLQSDSLMVYIYH